jgi:hypothetical protein
MALPLPKVVQEKVAAMPETAYGANRVTLILRDGRRIFDVDIAWAAEIAKVGGREVKEEKELGFLLQEIIDVTR